MHADIHQLLSLRDGEPVDASVASHVKECATCEAELTRLSVMRTRLQALPSVDVPPAAWAGIRARMNESQSAPPRRSGWAIAAGVTVALVTGLVVRELVSRQEASSVASAPPPQIVSAATAVPLEELVAQSRELDELLNYLPQRPAVERVSMAVTIDTIQQRVQWLDQQLSYAPDTGLDEAQAYQLWRERVDLMDSLVKVRYAEGNSLSF